MKTPRQLYDIIIEITGRGEVRQAELDGLVSALTELRPLGNPGFQNAIGECLGVLSKARPGSLVPEKDNAGLYPLQCVWRFCNATAKIFDFELAHSAELRKLSSTWSAAAPSNTPATLPATAAPEVKRKPKATKPSATVEASPDSVQDYFQTETKN